MENKEFDFSGKKITLTPDEMFKVYMHYKIQQMADYLRENYNEWSEKKIQDVAFFSTGFMLHENLDEKEAIDRASDEYDEATEKIDKIKTIANENIEGAFEWIVGGYYNSLQDDCLGDIPDSAEEILEEVYNGAINNKYIAGAELFDAAPREMRFAGKKHIENHIKHIAENSGDFREILEAKGIHDFGIEYLFGRKLMDYVYNSLNDSRFSEMELQTLSDVMEGHDYSFAKKNEKFGRVDMCNNEFQEYSLSEGIQTAVNWIDELISSTLEEINEPTDMIGFANSQAKLSDYKATASILNRMYEKDGGRIDFCSDRDKMIDFYQLTKEEFLLSYSYLSEAEYDATARKVSFNLDKVQEKNKSI